MNESACRGRWRLTGERVALFERPVGTERQRAEQAVHVREELVNDAFGAVGGRRVHCAEVEDLLELGHQAVQRGQAGGDVILAQLGLLLDHRNPPLGGLLGLTDPIFRPRFNQLRRLAAAVAVPTGYRPVPLPVPLPVLLDLGDRPW